MPLGSLPGPAASRVKVTRTQRGRSVTGSVTIARAGSRLTVRLLAKLRRKPVKVGGTTKRASAGTATFSVKLNRTAKNFLRRHRKLRLTVRITVTPATGVPFTATTKLTLRR